MIRNKLALISSAILFIICMSFFFPFPNNELIDVRTTIMSFPISNKDGYIVLGIIGAVLFGIALILLVLGLKKYHFRMVILVFFSYALLPLLLITMYQETLASGINAISYNGNGTCEFEDISEDLIIGDCTIVLKNHSNEAVTFILEFLDANFMDDGMRMESLMNIAGPYAITLEANEKKSIRLNEVLNVAKEPLHIISGTSNNVHVKIMDGEKERSL